MNIIYMYPCLKKYIAYFWSHILVRITCINNIFLPRAIFYTIESKTFCISDWKDWRYVSASCSPTATAATLRHLCAPLMHIAQRLNLIIIMLNQGSSCENSSPGSAPRPQNIYNCLVIFINTNVVNLWPNK